MEKLESVQYSAAIAESGTWRGTSREKLYKKRAWESSFYLNSLPEGNKLDPK